MKRVLQHSIMFSLLAFAGLTACYQPIDLTPAEDPGIPWVHCILRPGDTQHLTLRYLARPGTGRYEGINEATVRLDSWDRHAGQYVPMGTFSNVGDGEWEIHLPGLAIGSMRDTAHRFRLQVLLPCGDTLTAHTSSVGLHVDEIPPELPEPRLFIFSLHGEEHSLMFKADASRSYYRVASPSPIWASKTGWSEDRGGWYLEEELATNREAYADRFNRSGRNFTHSEVPEALSGYPGVAGQPLHYRYIRFPQVTEQDTLAFSGDFSGNHYGIIGTVVTALRGVHFAQVTVDAVAGIPHDTTECNWILKGLAGKMRFTAVSPEYDRYLLDVVQYQLLHEIGTDVIGIYDNTNIYTNIQGGAGIFGATCDTSLFWTCGVWAH